MMKFLTYFLLPAIIIFVLVFTDRKIEPPERLEKVKKKPNDWFVSQRMYPQKEINYKIYERALKQSLSLRQIAPKKLSWNFIGPSNIGGRITDVEMHHGDNQIIYAGAASGGIFKSHDGGQNWYPVFDDQLSLSIGDLAVDPSDPMTIYAGTGESNAGGGSVAYGGMGIFRSKDGGQNWTHIGLSDSRYIGRIIVDPDNSQRIYVAAMGKLFGTNAERGVYRTLDGGNNWERVLFVNDSTGCIDLVINPDSTNIIYAAMWERIRRPWGRNYGGFGSALYRSRDGGNSWQKLTKGVPANAANIGRIGICISPSNPEILYAIFADDPGYFMGVYKTSDKGDNWTRVNDYALSNLFSSYGWWFGNIRVHPANPDIIYAMGLDLYRSTDAGQSWSYFSGSMHVDQHGLYISPSAPYFSVAGNDGGIYISQQDNGNWIHVNDLPVTQFYSCETDQSVSNRYYGGTQDNGTLRTLDGNPINWAEILGGDGFYVLVDPVNNNYVYAEYQWGNLYRSTDGGNYFVSATNGINLSDRNNWSTPVVMDPSQPAVLYYGTNRIYKSTDRAQNWSAISGDLSNGPGPGGLPYGTTTTIAIAPSDGDYIYAGTDDGNIWVTKNGGGIWLKRSVNLPQRWVTRVAVDFQNPETAFVTFSGYRENDYLSHIFMTENSGQSWVDISSNLPEAPLNDIIVDNLDNNTLYVASDVGVFCTRDLGVNWFYVGSGLPNVPVTDLVVHKNDRKLVAATFGRSMYWIDLNLMPTLISKENTNKPENIILSQNYPNPFNHNTAIKVKLNNKSRITLEIFDIQGRFVKTIFDGTLQSGSTVFYWDGKNQNNNEVAGGTYIYRLINENRIKSKRMVFLP